MIKYPLSDGEFQGPLTPNEATVSAIRVWIADLKDIHPEGTDMSMIATNQPVVSKSDHDLAMQTLRDERDRLRDLVRQAQPHVCSLLCPSVKARQGMSYGRTRNYA